MQIPYLKRSKTAVLIAIFFAIMTFPSLVQANNDDVFSFSSKWFSNATVRVASFGSSVFDEVWCVAKSILDVGELCENVPQPLPERVTVTNKTPNSFVALVPDAQIPPSPPESLIDKTREPVTQVIQQEGPTYVTNKYITNPTTIIREVIREFDGESNGDFVERTLFDAQTTATLDSIQSTASGLQDSIADSVTTAALTVSGNSTLASLSASGAVTFSLLTGGVLQTDSNGLISTTTIGAAAVTNDSLDFSQLVDNFTLDATATFDLDTNSADMNFDSGTFFIDSSTNSVGIGTTTPGSLLTVAGTTNITGATTLDSTLTVTGNTTLVNASTTNLTVSGASYFGGQLNLTGSSANITLGSNYLSGDGGDEGVFVSSGGLVGIGTTTPSEALTVVGGISSAGEGTANEVYGLGATLVSGPGNGNTLVGAYTEMAAAGFGQYNTIVGAYSSSSNAYNTIIGSRSSATGGTSVLIGESLSSSVTYSTVIGANSSVTGTGLLAMGYSAQSSHNNAVAIGWGVASAEDYEYVFGSRAVASTSPSIRLAGSTTQYNGQDLFELDTEWIDSTDATRKSRATLSVYDTAQRTFMQADATGSGVTTSFNGGSVGIGTTTPLSRLAIQTTGTTDIFNLYETGGSKVLSVLESGFVGIGASTPAHMVHIKNNSSTYAGLDLEGGQAGDAQWVLFSGYPSAGDFSVRESGVQTSLTIKKTTGNVGIATTTPGRKLTVAGTVEFRGLTAAVGAGSLCLSSSNEVVYNSGSDNCLSSTRNTKHAITPLTLDAINILNELEPVSFIYNGTDRVRYGFIAENTASVDDILATYNADGDLTGIDDRSILSVMVRAFQEFYREVMDRFTTQDSRIDALEERIRELEAREGIDSTDSDEEENIDESTAEPDVEVVDEEVDDTNTEPPTVEEPTVQETDPVADEAPSTEEPEVVEETEVAADVENNEEVEEESADETLGL